jgi:ABC-type transport system involved in cytochrome bd biosynthesis fused ATPase/permease subunit
VTQNKKHRHKAVLFVLVDLRRFVYSRIASVKPSAATLIRVAFDCSNLLQRNTVPKKYRLMAVLFVED